MTTKKRTGGESSGGAPAKKRTAKRTPAGGAAGAAAKRRTQQEKAATPRPAVRRIGKSAPQPRIRASHGATPDAPASSAGTRPLRALPVDTGGPARRGLERKPPGPAPRKAPLAGPKRTVARRAPAVDAAPGPSSEARELALALAGAGIEKKAIGIEILDVTGKVDYADFLVVMTGRSDRHVHSIATGLEEAMRGRKLAPLSIEGLTASTWVLIDFGEVVVHVFQEEARALYDIEGLWIDAGRVPVPAETSPVSGQTAVAEPPYSD